MPNISNKLKSDCTGCGACYAICSQSCITMEDDEEGFRYPFINIKACTNCNICYNICPKNILEQRNMPKAYYAKNKDINIQLESSSGGIFSALAYEIIDRGGVVIGAAFDKDFKVCHIVEDRIENLDKIRGSKYVQSNMESIFHTTEALLKLERDVLFTGVPCEIAAIKSYLNRDYKNLYTMDVICHGVPGNKVWIKYINELKQLYKANVKKFYFRDKSEEGWHKFHCTCEFSNGERYSKWFNIDPFGKTFINNLFLRPSCYSCKFKGASHISDLTIGDFWGIENISKELDDNKGISLLLIQSEKGKNLINSVKAKIELIEVPCNEAIKGNWAIMNSPSRPDVREKAFEALKHLSLRRIANKYCNPSLKSKIKHKVKDFLSLANANKH